VADADPRRRRPGETPGLVRAGALERGFEERKVEIINDPIKAIKPAFSIVKSGDLIVVQVDEVEPLLNRVMEPFDSIAGTSPFIKPQF